ncbi:unknown [Mycoplasma sp. CAG:776]|nr:unknown [Mycoplasma sp. CAG:776]
MKILSPEVTRLLDKLYNLRGSDSVVFKEMESAHQKAEETKERTTAEKAALQEKIAGLEADSKNLSEQGKKLIEVLKGIDKKSFETVIDRLHINFDPEALVERLDSSLPETIESVNDDIKSSKEELVKVEEEMNSAITTIEEIGIRRDAAVANQEKLNEYFELALAGNINITRDSITSLLEQFDLSEEETREAAKILMFPEDALYDYDAKIKESEKKSISEVMQEARNQEETVQKVEEILVKEEPAKEEENVQEPVEVKEVVEPVVQKKFDREDLIDLFNDIGLDYLDYTTSDLDQILDHFNEKVIRRNINIFKENDLSLDIFADHINLIYDRELEAKVDRLLRIGKSALDIYLNPTVLTKYDYKGLDKAILLLQNSGLDPKKVPLMAY